MIAQSPWEYAHQLQREHQSAESAITLDVCDVLTANIVSALPTQHRAQIEDCPIVVLPTKQVNAFIMPSPGKGAVIAVDFGILSFMNALNKITICRMHGFGMEPVISPGDAKRMMRQAFEYFFGDRENRQLPRWPISPKRLLVASTLSNVQVGFIVGHEIGHAVLGHLDEAPAVESERVDARVFSFADHLKEESDADLEAAKLLMAHFKKIYDPMFGSSEPSYSQAAIDILFTYLEGIEKWTGHAESETHPVAALRKKKLREFTWKKMPEMSREVATLFESTFMSILPAKRLQPSKATSRKRPPPRSSRRGNSKGRR